MRVRDRRKVLGGNLVKRTGLGLLAFLLASGCVASAQTINAASPGRWQPPPPPTSWDAQEHHGYMDGIEAAWLDLADKLPPKPSRHTMYRHPPNVKVNRIYSYQVGFRKGYAAVYHHDRPDHAAQSAGGQS